MTATAQSAPLTPVFQERSQDTIVQNRTDGTPVAELVARRLLQEPEPEFVAQAAMEPAEMAGLS